MSNKDGQMELPRKPGQAKQAKKQRTRRKRSEAKKIDGEKPLHNKYHGYH
jgi:hypothetical protein